MNIQCEKWMSGEIQKDEEAGNSGEWKESGLSLPFQDFPVWAIGTVQDGLRECAITLLPWYPVETPT